MPELTAPTGWARHLVYRSEHLRTTWKLRLGLLGLVILALWLTSGWWTVAIAAASCLKRASDRVMRFSSRASTPTTWYSNALDSYVAPGLLARVLVPVSTDRGTSNPNAVALGIVDVMAKVSRIGQIDIIPVREVEPITINVLRDVQSFLDRERIRSLIVVTPLFRSRRSELVYAATLGRAGVTLHFQPVQGSRGVSTWTRSWHGMQAVTEQWLKLQYYRLFVLPFV